jgi:hypothetical protein
MTVFNIGYHADIEAVTQQVADGLTAVSFPLTVTLENMLMRNLVLPEINASFTPTNTTGALIEVSVESADTLMRAVSSIEQIAQLNGVEVAVKLSFDVPVVEAPKGKGKAQAVTPETVA